MVRGERPFGRAHERQGEAVEALRRPVPGELVVELRDRRPEVPLEAPPDERVQPVRRRRRGRTARRARRRVRTTRPNSSATPTARARSCRSCSSSSRPMAEKPTPSIRMRSPLVDERDVAPRLHLRRDERVGRLVVLAQELERALGEDDAETPGHVASGSARRGARRRRGAAPSRAGEVEPGRAAAEDRDAHERCLPRHSTGRSRM